MHDELMDWRGPGGAREDFIILTPQEHTWLKDKGFEPKRIPVKRGDVILWRSDLVHKGAPPLGRSTNFRAVVYVCMLPAALTPEAVYRQKVAAYEQLQTGCHWPNREEWFHPRRHHAEYKPYFKKPPKLSLRQQQLYGLVCYDPSNPQTLSAASTKTGTEGENIDTQNAAAVEGDGSKAKVPRRWGRESKPSKSAAALLDQLPQAAASRADHLPQAAASTDGYAPKCTAEADDSCKDTSTEVRRLRKALREIEALEVRRDNGEELRKNQLEKIERKQWYLCDLQRVTPEVFAKGGS